MLTMTTSIIISFILAMIVMLITTILPKKLIYGREKSPFECGFDPKSSSRMPFSIWFFLIAVMFLNFNVEIALILPITIIMKTSNITVWTISTTFFICILLGGLFYEWNQGALKWAD